MPTAPARTIRLLRERRAERHSADGLVRAGNPCRPERCLVACLQGKWSDHGLKVQALFSDGSTLALELTLTKADYENEPAVRIASRRCIRKIATWKCSSPTRSERRHHAVSAAALRHRRHARARAQSMKGGVRQFHLKPDRFIDIQHAIGVVASEDFMAQLAELLRSQLTGTDLCGRFGGNGFLVMLERGTAKDVETWARMWSSACTNMFRARGQDPVGHGHRGLGCCPPIPTSLPPSPMRSAPRAAGGNSAATDVCRGQSRHRHPGTGLRQDLGEAHQERLDGESLPSGAAADREPAGRRQRHVRRAGAHAGRTGQRSPASGVHRGGRTQRPDEEHRSLGDRRIHVLRRQPQGRLHFRAPVEGHPARQEPAGWSISS